ncbi:porin [Candidatus Pelagibacter bacterium]|nr:porin [Candidatus Pelagibacter bacterium]MDA8801544.1 porin [Candidatus Pelagibacter bacterium]
MNNLKKIGLTALATTLVASSVFAGEMSVNGNASIAMQHVTDGDGANAGKKFQMGNQLTFTGSGELDNGLTVGLSFILDQGDDTASDGTDGNANSPFDTHSVSISSDVLGTFTFIGEGGDSAQNAMHSVVTGELYDNDMGGTAPSESSAGNNTMTYYNSSLYDGLTVGLSYTPRGSNSAGQTTEVLHESATAYSIQYDGVEGLSVGYASGENTLTKGKTADVDSYFVTYAYGPVTVGYGVTEYDSEDTATDADQDYSEYEIAYTVTDNVSISYGVETLETPNKTSDVDQEVTGIKASYTSGGMTLGLAQIETDNAGFNNAATKDDEMWEVSLSFAF